MGDKTIVLNNCPVNLKCAICKVFEFIIKDHSISYALDYNITCIQLGFMNGRSICGMVE